MADWVLPPDAIVDESVDPYRELFVKLLALPDDLVRKRWPAGAQDPRAVPAPTVNWVLLGSISLEPDDTPVIEHRGGTFAGADGYDVVTEHPLQTVLVSCYGPNARGYASTLRRGLSLPQNVESLAKQAISFVECGIIRAVPEKQNSQWVNRADMLVVFRRRQTTRYGVRNIESADIHLFDDTHVDEIIEVNKP